MEKKIGKILIAIDDSSYAMKAAETGFTTARALRAAVGLLYAIDPAKEVTPADIGMTPEESEWHLRHAAERTLKTCKQLFGWQSEVTLFTPTGIPEEAILKVADAWHANLIVMGTHGRSAVGRILSGSKAEYVVRHATIPVLLAPPRMK